MYVHSATYEPFGLALIEAMAAGLPVITLDGGGNRDIIEQHKNGMMLFKQDAHEFAQAIHSLAEDENQYRSISNNAIEFARNYDIKNYVDKLLDLYEK
jgi:glycosyltransferase involved in cell wall biosynthesis